MVSRVDAVLGMPIYGDEEDDIIFSTDAGISNPYFQYEGPGTSAPPNPEKVRSKSKKSSSSKTNGDGGVSSSARPKSASRRRDADNRIAMDEPTSRSSKIMEEEYPTARGLIRK